MSRTQAQKHQKHFHFGGDTCSSRDMKQRNIAEGFYTLFFPQDPNSPWESNSFGEVAQGA